MMRRSSSVSLAVLLTAAAMDLLVHQDASAMLKDSAINHDTSKARRYFEHAIHADSGIALDQKPLIALPAIHGAAK